MKKASNYVFKDGNGYIRNLPTNAVVTPSLDDKSVIIEFPSSFTIGSGNGGTGICQLGVKNVKDINGKLLELGSYIGNISTGSGEGPEIIKDEAQITWDGNDIKVKVSLTASLDILSLNDFRVDGYAPDSGYCSGSDVILLFKSGIKNNEKIDAIKDSGSSINLSVVNNNSVDSAGCNIKSGSTTVYIPPIAMPDLWSASSSNTDTVTVVFNQNIDDEIKTSYDDDFIFTNSSTGEELTPTTVSINGKNVIYKFSSGSLEQGDNISICANSDSSKINIRSEQHGDSGYTLYIPSSDDLEGKTIIVD
ncbi:hypothetical protein [Clostridium sp. BJN0013]|uniref:hypothetical protein n=1 Tax=Clostridium sp. BJN0013 TaxID=3236840 RepID=UPI0034C6A396